jgi:hypothetical protein
MLTIIFLAKAAPSAFLPFHIPEDHLTGPLLVFIASQLQGSEHPAGSGFHEASLLVVKHMNTVVKAYKL